MTAIVVVPFGISAAWAIGSIAITLAAWVVMAQWGSPKAKRIIGAAVVAGLLSMTVLYGSEDAEAIMQDPCKRHEPWSFFWIAAGCFLP